MNKIIIAGSRHFDDYKLLVKSVKSLLKELHISSKSIQIISGCAKGADSLGGQLAMNNNLSVVKFPAKWDEYGKSAGYIRNKEMSEYCNTNADSSTLLAFWDGESKGTKHMIDIATKEGLNVKVIKY